jgi:hypothetical protein
MTRGGDAEPPPTASTPPKPPARRSSGSSTCTETWSRPASRSPASAASHAGSFVLLGVLTRSRAQATACPVTSPARAAAVTAGSAPSAATTVTVSSRGGCGVEVSRKR